MKVLGQKMSLFGKVFKSRKRKQEAASSQESIDKLRDVEALLIKKQLHYEEKIGVELSAAQRHGKKNKTAALAALRRKKHYELELTKIDNSILKLECQRQALENAGSNVEIMTVLSETTKVLRTANMKMDIDTVDSLMDDMRESLDTANEISDAISTPIGETWDEDELMNELRELEEDPTPLILPSVPTRRITRSMSRDTAKIDEEMHDLEKWAAAN